MKIYLEGALTSKINRIYLIIQINVAVDLMPIDIDEMLIAVIPM